MRKLLASAVLVGVLAISAFADGNSEQTGGCPQGQSCATSADTTSALDTVISEIVSLITGK